MRVPLLILCLAVIYGTCRAYDGDVNLVKGIANDEDYKLDSIVPFERSLSRQKRTISVLVKPILKIFGLRFALIEPMLKLAEFGFGVMFEQIECPKIEKLSFKLIEGIITRPVQTIETIICYVFHAIGSTGRAVIKTGLKATSKFIRKILLPGTHKALNNLNDRGLIPPSLKPMVAGFNALYAILRLMGYVG